MPPHERRSGRKKRVRAAVPLTRFVLGGGRWPTLIQNQKEDPTGWMESLCSVAHEANLGVLDININRNLGGNFGLDRASL